MGYIGATWAITGFFALLGYAIHRLAGHANEALASGLGLHHWVVLVVVVLFMAYSEGYKGFQRGYSPRFVARVGHLYRNPTPTRVVLAPLFCMGYFHAPRRRVIAVLVLTVGIIMLVLLFRLLPQPWRGVLDAGVVVGLAWGVAATVVIGVRMMLVDKESGVVDPEVPSI